MAIWAMNMMPSQRGLTSQLSKEVIKIPTGYTERIYNGEELTLQEFATICARGMGAFYHQRDDGKVSLRRPVLDISFWQEKMNKVAAATKEWNELDDEAKRVKYNEYVEEYTQANIKSNAKRAELSARYNKLLAEVDSLEVPESLSNFKRFMAEQLQSSLDFDCFNVNLDILSYSEWVDKTESDFSRDINYYLEEVGRAKKRHEETNAFIDDMIAYFGIEVE